MPLLTLSHPSSDALSAFTEAVLSSDDSRVAIHVAECAECREAVRLVRSIRAAAQEAIIPPPSSALRERMLHSRSTGARIALPGNDTHLSTSSKRWITVPAAVAATAIIAVLGQGILSSSQEADAGNKSGTMTISPTLPRPGQLVQITYHAPASLARFSSLVVRARLRSTNSDAYESGIPVRTLATLTHTKGSSYSARVTLPDSIVFAALAVEDSTGTIIDDREKRTWEVLASADGQRPLLSALNQRANDMMGRNFEEGHATTRRMVRLYPDSLSGWSYFRAFGSWIGIGQTDSVLSLHRAVLHRLERPWRPAKIVPERTLGYLAWYAQSLDSVAALYWRNRLMREAPRDGFAIQWRLGGIFQRLSADHDTAAALRLLDTLWEDRTPERAIQVASRGLGLAIDTQRRDVIDSWWTRALSVTGDSVAAEISFGEQLGRVRPLANLGIERLRNIIPRLSRSGGLNRRLSETTVMRERRVTALHRRVLASLGRAMVTSGSISSGLDTLKLAARSGWDLSTFRAIRDASLATGDSATAWSMTAMLLADPSTTDRVRDSLAPPALRAIGSASWSAMQRDGAQMFSRRMLEESRNQALLGNPRLRSADGREISLRDRVAGRITVIAFWSRYCGWALDDLASLKSVAQRLERVGSQLVIVINDEAGPSAGLNDFLKDHRVRVPVQFDVGGSTSKAFNNWGSPQYYVLDERGRLRFAAVGSAMSALARAEALRKQ